MNESVLLCLFYFQGLAPPLQQLRFLEQLVMVIQADSSVNSRYLTFTAFCNIDLTSTLSPALLSPCNNLMWSCFYVVCFDGCRQNSSSGDDSVRNDDLLRELMVQDHLSDLDMLLNPVCNPWPAHIREYLIRTQSAHNKMNGKQHSKPSDFINRSV